MLRPMPSAVERVSSVTTVIVSSEAFFLLLMLSFPFRRPEVAKNDSSSPLPSSPASPQTVSAMELTQSQTKDISAKGEADTTYTERSPTGQTT